ncbi:MAG: biotin/lipoyl-containing protein [Bryobacteraceae bacterium]|jgi:acetyl-CoA carboxylase biotin carboxyl carrier protein
MPAKKMHSRRTRCRSKQGRLLNACSPIVGIFYDAPPDAELFLRVGEHVTPGKVLCIIETEELIIQIESEVAGIVESKLAQNGQLVEDGEVLFGIRLLPGSSVPDLIH